VTCVYVNATLKRFWIIDYGIDTPDTDGKKKPDHVSDMLAHAIRHKRLAFRTVRMDSGYASKALMLQLHAAVLLESVPLAALYRAHGVCRNECDDSIDHDRCTKGVRCALEH
jgi:hypothetical protein